MKSENNVKKMELRDLRLRMGLTQQGLADSLGMNSRYISMVESGLKPCSEKMLKKVELLCDAKHAQAPPDEVASLSRQTNHAACPRCAALEKEIVWLKDQVSGLVMALAAKPTMCAPAPRAYGAGCGTGEKKEKRGA